MSKAITAAAKEIADRTDVDFLSLAGIRDILTRHFGQDDRIAELELHNQLLRDRLDAIRLFVAEKGGE